MSTESTLAPFHIEITDDALDDLRSRLHRTRLPQALPGDSWATGVPVAHLQALTTRWAEHDWRATEARLNRLPQFITEIDGQSIHLVHVRSAVPDATPIVLTHGWPGSFLEFEGLIGPLTDPEAYGGTHRPRLGHVDDPARLRPLRRPGRRYRR